MQCSACDSAGPALRAGLCPEQPSSADDNSAVLDRLGKMLEKREKLQVVAALSDGQLSSAIISG